MALYIKDPVTDKTARRLAKLRKCSVTEVIRSALIKELEAEEKPHFDEATVDALIAEVASWPKTGLKADKDYFDSLYDD